MDELGRGASRFRSSPGLPEIDVVIEAVAHHCREIAAAVDREIVVVLMNVLDREANGVGQSRICKK
jgi:hypothetical protein